MRASFGNGAEAQNLLFDQRKRRKIGAGGAGKRQAVGGTVIAFVKVKKTPVHGSFRPKTKAVLDGSSKPLLLFVE